MTNKVYLAGKWADKPLILEFMNQIKGLGFEITHDWTKNEKTTNDPSELANFAKLDIDGVVNADIYIGVFTDPKYAYRGTFTELGAAIATNKKILLFCPDEKSYCCSNCFFHHPNTIHFNSWDKLISYLAV